MNELIRLKIQINNKKWWNNSPLGQWVVHSLWIMILGRKCGSLAILRHLKQSWLFKISQKFPNFHKAYLSQYLSFDHVLGHFGKVLKSSNQCLWSHVILIYQSQVIVFDLKCLFVDFWKWPIMLRLITFCESISWTWSVNRSCRKCHSLQNELWMEFFW